MINKKSNLQKVIETQCQHSTMTQRNVLVKLLQRFEESFDGTLGTRKKDPLEFDLIEDTKTICSQPYPVPKVHKEVFKNEVVQLVLFGVLEVGNNPEWGSPPFVKPKPK